MYKKQVRTPRGSCVSSLLWFVVESVVVSDFKPRLGVLAKNHVKGIIIVGVTQTGKKLTSSTPFEFPKEGKLDGVVLLGLKKKMAPLLAQMVFLSQFPLKTGSVQVVVEKIGEFSH